MGLPLGETACVGFPAMINLVGRLPPLESLLTIPQVHVHFYGKAEKPFRKVGHVTVRADSEVQREQRIVEVLKLISDKNIQETQS